MRKGIERPKEGERRERARDVKRIVIICEKKKRESESEMTFLDVQE